MQTEINKTHYLCFFIKIQKVFFQKKKPNNKLQLILAKKRVKRPVFDLKKSR